jgi:hypothetical protein
VRGLGRINPFFAAICESSQLLEGPSMCFFFDGAYDVKPADEESLKKLNNDICACSYFDGGQRDGKLCGLPNDLRCAFR